MANKTQNILTAAAVAIGLVTFSGISIQSARADNMTGSNVSNVSGSSTRALIDLRGARALLNLPDKQYMTDDDFAAVRHISAAIDNAQTAGYDDGQRSWFTPMTDVTTGQADRLDRAKKLVWDAKNELDSDSSSPLGTEIDAALRSIDKAIAAEDWRTLWSDDYNQYSPKIW